MSPTQRQDATRSIRRIIAPLAAFVAISALLLLPATAVSASQRDATPAIAAPVATAAPVAVAVDAADFRAPQLPTLALAELAPEAQSAPTAAPITWPALAAAGGAALLAVVLIGTGRLQRR